MAKKCALLVTGSAGDRNLIFKELSVGLTINAARGLNLGQHVLRNTQNRENFLIPLQLVNIIHQGAGSIGIVGYVHLATGELPNNPGINSTEKQATSVSLFAHTGDIF